MQDPRRSPRKQFAQAGISLVEVMIAAALLMMTSLSMALAYGSTGLSSRVSDQILSVQTGLETVSQSLDELPFVQLLSMNGVQLKPALDPLADPDALDAANQDAAAPYTIFVAVNTVELGLVLIELVAIDDTTNAVLSRFATYRSGEI